MDTLHQVDQHLSHLHDIRDARIAFDSICDVGIRAELQMVLEFSSRSDCDLQKLREIAVGLTATSFGDVGWN